MDKLLKKIVWLIIILPGIYLAIVWKHLPEKIAMHFDWKGNVDRYGDKNELITASILLILMNAVVFSILTNIYRIDPKKYAAENKNRLIRIGFAVSVFLSAVLCFIIYTSNHGNLKFSVSFILAGVGLLFAIIGNYMHTIKPNYFAGFRLPWTLENEENWRRTHLLAGKLWFSGGLFLAVICLLLTPPISIVVFFAVMLAVTIIPAVYSYRLYKEQKSTNS
jgi:immunity protein, SdpI family